jgi:hypothetical protein
MKVRGTVTRVVEGSGDQAGKVYFRPDDSEVYQKLALAHLTASGEVVVDASAAGGMDEIKVGAAADFELPGGEDAETQELPPRGDVDDDNGALGG